MYLFHTRTLAQRCHTSFQYTIFFIQFYAIFNIFYEFSSFHTAVLMITIS